MVADSTRNCLFCLSQVEKPDSTNQTDIRNSTAHAEKEGKPISLLKSVLTPISPYMSIDGGMQIKGLLSNS